MINLNQKTMTKEELAALLNGRDLSQVMTEEEHGQAKKDGLVVVYGASDDLIKIEGAICDGGCCYDGGEVFIDKNGILPDDDEINEDGMPAHFERKRKAEKIFALWCTKESFSWSYETRIPHCKFVVTDKNNDDEKCCEGIVFELTSLK